MRLNTSTTPLVTAVFGALATSLIFASAAAGSPIVLNAAHGHRLTCDGRIAARRALARVIRRTPDRTVLRDVPARIHRGAARTSGADDDEAIQNDGAAISVEPERLRAALEPLELLIPLRALQPRPQQDLRRSPRGPPAFS
jgi:hypothetical protein